MNTTCPLGDSGVSLSRLVYGVWRLADDSDTSVQQVRAKIDACLAQGISSFDHADIYGDYRCEALFGQALTQDKSLRQQMQLISKCDIKLLSEQFPDRRVKHYDTSAAYIQHSVDNSLRHLHTDHLDLLLLHRPDPLMDHHETGQALDALVSSGKVRAVGVSNFMPWDLDLLQSAMKQPLVVNQIELSLLERSAFINGQVAQLQRLNRLPMAWSPLAGGRLFSSDDPAALRVRSVLERLASAHNTEIDTVAYAWLLAHPAHILPVVGTNNLARIARIAEAYSVEIDRETWFELWTQAAGEEVA